MCILGINVNMNLETREDIVYILRREEDKIRLAKGAAYSGSEDTLANFKRNADRLGMTPFQIWAVYFNKHIDSINTAIANRPEYPIDKTEGLDGRIMDARIYLEILKCLLYEYGKELVSAEKIGFSSPAGSSSSQSPQGGSDEGVKQHKEGSAEAFSGNEGQKGQESKEQAK